jgi:hypothetical protein
MGSIEDRQRLKEEYKEHYKAVRELRKKAAEAERTSRIRSALNNMNTDSLMETFDEMLHKVREKIDLAEARLEIMLESRGESSGTSDDYSHGTSDGTSSGISESDRLKMEEFERKEKTRETLSKIRAEMGLLQNELDEKIEGMKDVHKSVGPSAAPRMESSRPTQSPTEPKTTESVQKTIGPKDDSKQSGKM